MKKWEYRVEQLDIYSLVSVKEAFTFTLAELGKDGWELVTIIGSGTQLPSLAILKRPVAQDSITSDEDD